MQRKHGDDDDEVIFDRTKRVKETPQEESEVEMEGLSQRVSLTLSRLTYWSDAGYRANAILLNGTPISLLPTARLFAYAKHFDTTPLGLEWVNDQTCIFVYDSNSLARDAFTQLQKSTLEDPDEDEFVTAKPIPIALWPPETRINKTLGMGEGLKGVLKMRWAKPDDVKKKGAKKESEFYRRHGSDAGKELFNGRDLPPAKRPRNDNDLGERGVPDQEMERQRLDAELDQFLQDSEEGSDAAPASPPSKMRSDYIAGDGRTLLDRFSNTTIFESDRNPAERLGLKDRLIMPLPRRARGGRGTRRPGNGDLINHEEESGSGSLWDRLSPADADSDGGRRRGGLGRYNRDTGDGGDGRQRRSRRGGDRPQKTQQELDDELDAFLRHE